MKANNFLKKLSIICLIIIVSFSFLPNLVTVEAAESTSDVKNRIERLLTNNLPVITETKVTTDDDITFTHPGIGVSKDILDNMQTHVRNYEEPWASAFIQFSEYGKSSTNPVIRVSKYNNDYMNIPWGGSDWSLGNIIIRNMAQDADTAYTQFIMWYITGNEVYRKNAIRILREWYEVQSISSIWDEQIRVSLAVFKFCLTADLLRNSTSTVDEYNWTSEDDDKFVGFLDLMRSKYDRAWHFMCQNSICDMALMASAIYRNDSEDYKVSIQRATTNPELGDNYDFTNPNGQHNADGSILSQIRKVDTNVITGESISSNIQLVEMGRDQGHAYDDIGALSILAITSYIQGTKIDPELGTVSTEYDSVNMFNFLDDRLLAGANYLCKYNLGYDVEYIPCYSGTNGNIYSKISDNGKGMIAPVLGILYSYYTYIEGRDDMDTNEESKYLVEAYKKIYPEGTIQDFLGDSVLIYTLDK